MLFLQQNSFWVSLPQDETGEAKIKLRRLTKQKYIEFVSLCTTSLLQNENIANNLDELKLRNLINDWIIEDWQGIYLTDKNNNPSPELLSVNFENKQRLLDNPDIDLFIQKCIGTFQTKTTEQLEEFKKKYAT